MHWAANAANGQADPIEMIIAERVARMHVDDPKADLAKTGEVVAEAINGYRSKIGESRARKLDEVFGQRPVTASELQPNQVAWI